MLRVGEMSVWVVVRLYWAHKAEHCCCTQFVPLAKVGSTGHDLLGTVAVHAKQRACGRLSPRRNHDPRGCSVSMILSAP
jgi:hypothetical protein